MDVLINGFVEADGQLFIIHPICKYGFGVVVFVFGSHLGINRHAV